MKKLLFITLVGVLTLSACKKDGESQTDEAQAKVTINGTQTSIEDLIFYTFSGNGNTYYNISSTNIYDDNSITIYLVNPTPGTASFGEDNAVSINIGSKTYNSTGTGSFTLTEVSNAFVSGSFSGTFSSEEGQIQISGNFTAMLKTTQF